MGRYLHGSTACSRLRRPVEGIEQNKKWQMDWESAAHKSDKRPANAGREIGEVRGWPRESSERY